MTVLLDTRSAAPADRSEYWSAGTTELFFPLQFQPFVSRPFAGRIIGHHIGPVGVRRVSGDPHCVVRTHRGIADADPEDILLHVVRSGRCRIEQDGRSCVLQRGDMASYDSSRPSVLEAEGAFELLVLTFPKHLLGAHGNRISQGTAVRIAGADALARLAAPFLAGIADGLDDDAFGDGARQDVAEVLVATLRMLHGDGARWPALPGRARSQALLVRMQEYAIAHLREPDLGPERIASAHFVSTRYVHKLFRAEGLGVSGWIRDRRLDGAVRDLRDPALADLTVAAIAAAWGFAAPGGFSRTFRAAYGCSPSEMRERSASR
jgi:AraC-like DNA-binding protein